VESKHNLLKLADLHRSIRSTFCQIFEYEAYPQNNT